MSRFTDLLFRYFIFGFMLWLTAMFFVTGMQVHQHDAEAEARDAIRRYDFAVELAREKTAVRQSEKRHAKGYLKGK